MTRTHTIRSIRVALWIPVVFLGVLGWLTYAQAQRAHLDHLLIEAIDSNMPARAIALLQQGADPNARDNMADRRSVWQTLRDSFRVSHPKTARGSTALMVAIVGRDKDALFPEESIPLIQALLDRGADVHARDHDGYTPLVLAAELGQRDTANLLIDHGADVNAKGLGGWSALIWAAMTGHKEMVKTLLDRGADINQPADGGRTALMWAIAIHQRRRMEIVQALLDRDPDLRIRDSRGWTALTCARQCGNPEIVRLLKRALAKAKHSGEMGASVSALPTPARFRESALPTPARLSH